MPRQPLRWETYEYYYREKGPDWYWAVWIVALAVALLSIILSNLSFGILILMATAALTLHAGRPPKKVRCEISERGVIIEKIFYPYHAIESFGIDLHTPELPKLLLKLKRPFVPEVILLLVNVDTEVVRRYLQGYLPERDHDEPLSLKVMEYLGF